MSDKSADDYTLPAGYEPAVLYSDSTMAAMCLTCGALVPRRMTGVHTHWHDPSGDELYRIAKERAEGKRPNVPWREGETAEERRARWNAANPQDPIEPTP